MDEILNRLSSRQSDRTENSNRKVATICVENPALLNAISSGFESSDRKLKSDCIEVFTMVSEKTPEEVAPFFPKISKMIFERDNKTRWEAVHTLSFITSLVPHEIKTILPDLAEMIEKDNSVIVRDYALDIVARYAGSGAKEAAESFPILVSALDIWEERHAKQVFNGFINIIKHQPALKSKIKSISEQYTECKKKLAADLAKKILKLIENVK
ncbi:MAG: hypothetical protein ACM3PT_04195 [Deltaproteobacteria bacterium]